MRKLAFIPTREEKERPIKVFLEKSGWEVHYLIGEKSIFDAYTKAFADFKIMAKDKIILCHDDIQIMTRIEIFNKIIDDELDRTTGFLGIAGPKRLNKTGCWWHGLGREFPHPEAFLRGCVWHGDTIKEALPTYYGGYGKTEAIDGLFMATTGATLNNINTKKPEGFTSDWDFYDLYYSYQAHLKGKHNKVVPIMILHNSVGEGAMGDEWNESRKAFIDLYGDKFIDVELPHQSQLPAPV